MMLYVIAARKLFRNDTFEALNFDHIDNRSTDVLHTSINIILINWGAQFIRIRYWQKSETLVVST